MNHDDNFDNFYLFLVPNQFLVDSRPEVVKNILYEKIFCHKKRRRKSNQKMVLNRRNVQEDVCESNFESENKRQIPSISQSPLLESERV